MKAEDILREANALARTFYLIHGYRARPDYRFDLSTHPQEQMMWRLAAAAYEALRGTDLDDVLAEMEA